MRFPVNLAVTLAIGLAALATALPLASCGNTPANPPTTIDVTVGGKTFRCKLAIDNASREQGLGGVASLAPDEGMLFAFTDSAERTFWMRGCIMDLDIAFLDQQGFVTAVHTMPKEPLQAEGESESAYLDRLVRYPSGGKAKYALEVAPGTLTPLGVRRGSRAEFDREALKPFIR
ncbi:MAG: DUF192 domain-containing protein [bacterium]|jgi:uncharacterized membrane protein (UPF0127 family)